MKRSKQILTGAIILSVIFAIVTSSVMLVYAASGNFTKREAFETVPLYNQRDYDDVAYGEYGTISSHGCGIVCISMVYTYLTDEYQSPEMLAKKYGNYNTPNGSYWSLFADSAEDFDLVLEEQTSSWKKVKEALQNGQIVISLQRKGIFTRGGHFIVLTGINEDGKIMVNDPNGSNWDKNETLREGFENGFKESQITNNGHMYWIYAPKNSN